MARGSGAGTGVIVALVVSVAFNLGLLTITFVMHAGKMEAVENEARTEKQMEAFVTNAERSDAFARVMDAAAQERRSLYWLLESRRKAIADFVAGNPNAGIAEMRSGLGIGEGDSVTSTLRSLRDDLRTAETEVSSLEREVADLRTNNEELRAGIDRARDDGDKAVLAVEKEFKDYGMAADQYEQEVGDAIASIEATRSDLDRQHRTEIAQKEEELNDVYNEKNRLQEKVQELTRKTEMYRIKPENPATLVDGRVVSVPGSGGVVFIDLGREDRVAVGMTFEVYEDAAAIRPDPETNEYVRGKASIEIIRVGDGTSTARITREIPGRPVVKDDVLANAVFDSDYRFKFLVHGLFDLNNDGNPSVADGDYVRRMIQEWGGVLVESDKLPGDLDFLVLGVQPAIPVRPALDASRIEEEAYRRALTARRKYDDLFEKATEAQIPVLNWNRFQTLTGMGGR